MLEIAATSSVHQYSWTLPSLNSPIPVSQLTSVHETYIFNMCHTGERIREAGVFGGPHFDDGDSACSLSTMVPCSDLPAGYDPGRFHLLPLGVFFVLSGIHPIVFSGRIYHGGTAPLAPANVTKVEPWAYRFVMIFYPASRIITGTTQPFMASSGILGRGLNLPYETFGYEYVSPDSVFFLF